MILDFDDSCWAHNDDDWKRSLLKLLMLVESREQHAVLADRTSMLAWCGQHLPLFKDYYTTRLAGAQPRANGLTITISPAGAGVVSGPPPWRLNAIAAGRVVMRPLRLVLENDSADKLFVEASVPGFAGWCTKEWIQPVMGGGSAMKAKIDSAAFDDVDRWRTFFLFDSDRLHPDELFPVWSPPGGDGCQGYIFQVACAQMPQTRWHRLHRRSIENYLPAAVLHRLNPATTEALSSVAGGGMDRFYNMKEGLKGDGVSPTNPKKAVRAARRKGFWTSLPQEVVFALEAGFGLNVADEFAAVAPHQTWPRDVIDELTALSNALQDAM